MRRLVVGDSPWVAPRGASLVTLAVAWGAWAAGVVWAYHWARGAQGGGEVLAAAALVTDAPIALERALDVSWRFAMDHAEGPEARLASPVAPSLPPPLCVPSEATELNASVADLEHALVSGSRLRMERALRELGRVEVEGVEDGDLVRSYALARGHLAAGDAVTAAQLLDALDGGSPLQGDQVPIVSARRARELSLDGEVEHDRAAAAVLVRYLAGLAASRRGRHGDAVPHLRFAVNALAYGVEPGDRAAPGAARSRRRPVDPGRYACADSRSDDTMDSMDVYAALVRAYLESEDFTDPTRLRDELRRGPLETDPADPLAPVLAGALGGRLRIPEHLLWAASNLQRLEHHNRLHPDPRLALVRGLLVLELTDRATSVGLSAAETCRMLDGMALGASESMVVPPMPAPLDSALAGVTLAVLARRTRDCGEEATLDADVRSALLARGGGRVAGGLPGRLERARIEIERALAPGAPVRTSGFAELLATTDADLSMLRRGRIPPDLLQGLEAEEGARTVAAWRRALFEDVARALAPLVSRPTGTHRTAGEARTILEALGGATVHAGLRPRDLYGPGQVVWAAGTGGLGPVATHLGRFGARSHPLATAALMAGVFLLGALAVLWAHVSWWRYELVTSRRFYVAETLARWRAEMEVSSGVDAGEGP